MLSRAADALPDADGWQFEPKWDGFRTIVFRDGNEVVQVTDGRPTDSWVKSG
jgi:ATP-dependent DNA ligase